MLSAFRETLAELSVLRAGAVSGSRTPGAGARDEQTPLGATVWTPSCSMSSSKFFHVFEPQLLQLSQKDDMSTSLKTVARI